MANVARKQKAKPKRTDKAQSERFKKAARDVGADESAAAFERTFAKIVPPRKKTQT